jgi:hypothetical protein
MPTLTELSEKQRLYIDNTALSIFGGELNTDKTEVTIRTTELDDEFKQLTISFLFSVAP